MTENYHCCCIKEPVIFSHYVHLQLGHQFHTLLKVCSDRDNIVPLRTRPGWTFAMIVLGVISVLLPMEYWNAMSHSHSSMMQHLQVLCTFVNDNMWQIHWQGGQQIISVVLLIPPKAIGCRQVWISFICIILEIPCLICLLCLSFGFQLYIGVCVCVYIAYCT